MRRINVYAHDEIDGRYLAGWFDLDKAEQFDAGKEWDGNNMVSKATGYQGHDEWLLRTAGGRWVLGHSNHDLRTGPAGDWYEFTYEDKAREWLLRNELDDDAVRLFGPIEPERGPGRPEIGPAVNTRIPDDILAQVDRYASEGGVSRAAMIRNLLVEALDARS